ncbi:Mitochondrial beta-keto-acyl synthase [Balamuthia mandrillaris]
MSALRPLQRRVVVTGLGVVCPLGVEVPLVWPRLLNGECGIRAITEFDVSALPSKIAAFVPKGKSVGEFDVTRWVDERDVQNTPPFLQYILCAAEQAMQDSGWKPSTEEQKERTGVAIGNGLGSLDELTNTAFTLHSQGYRRVSPHFIPKILLNMGAGRVSLKYGLRGPNHTCSTACATGAHSIGDASRLIQYGDADVMLAGGAEACISPLSMAGFCRMKALSSKFNDTPEKASRPFDKARDGFVMGEGAGVIVLEEYEHAKARGARIYAEVGGYGLSGDAHHITAPSPEGDGAYRAMMTALRHSGLSPEQVDYVNAHATSTPLGKPPVQSPDSKSYGL